MSNFITEKNTSTMSKNKVSNFRYTTDTICSLAFGVESKTLKHPDNDFRYYGDLSYKVNKAKTILAMFAPGILKFLCLPIFNTEATKFFTQLFISMVNKRRTENTKRSDFLSVLMELLDYEKFTDIGNSSVSDDINAGKILNADQFCNNHALKKPREK